MYEQIKLERPAEHVARVVLNRPDQANAFSAQLLDELDHAVQAIAADDDVRVWMLTGAPRDDGRPWFSAGLDMKDALSGAVPAVEPVRIVDLIDDMLKPSIAVINGLCTTGALEVALACDLRVAARSARLSDLHLERSGLGIGGWGMAARLSRLVGVDKAKELLLLSCEVDGTEAARIGLVNRVVEDAELDAFALDWAVTLASRPRRGIRTTLGYLSLQSEMSKREAMRWAELAPELMGLTLRPFSDAAARFFDQREQP
ncbi:MAG: enoyl-CoA hydratase/isomerase family protein [Mycobacteriales bacterium]